MNTATKIILAVVLTVTGAAGVIIADRAGWFGPTAPNGNAVAAGLCEHGISVARCPFCDPSLVEKLGFCAGHDVDEAYCTRCSPDIIPAFKAMNDWCGEHGLPESQCLICNPSLASGGEPSPVIEPASLDVEVIRDQDAIARWQRDPSVTCTKSDSIVVLSSADIADSVGLNVEPVRVESISRTLEVNGEIRLNANATVTVSSRAAGVVHQTLVDLGDQVEAGDGLMIIDAVDVADAKGELLQAQAMLSLWERNHEREQDLLSRGVSTEREALEAETKLVESKINIARAEQRLRNLGLSDEDIATIVDENDTSPYLTITAPQSGTIIERFAYRGELVDSKSRLFVISDMSRVWAMLDIHESDAPLIEVGQPVTFRVDGLRGETFGGVITWEEPRVDPTTRTLRARAEIRNDGGRLRTEMFGRGLITVADDESLAVVPKSAIQWDGCCNLVFVKQNEQIYEPRKVRLGFEVGDYYTLLDGVESNEAVVTDGSFLLKTEIMKGSIGAGCCEMPGA